jgi:acetyl-CoA C-acetyltransferase
MSRRDVVLCAPVRTAIGTFNGSLQAVPATELGATVIRTALARAKVDTAKIGTAVMGNVVQAGNKMNPARQAAMHGGLPAGVPAMTVNRVCGSGAQAIVSAAQEIMLGMVDSAVAGGMENMDQAPYLMSGGRWGYRMGDAQIYDSMLRDGLNDAFSVLQVCESLPVRKDSTQLHIPEQLAELLRGCRLRCTGWGLGSGGVRIDWGPKNCDR